jgi:hypothetical protein
MQPLESYYPAIAAFGGALVALAAYHLTVVRPGFAAMRRGLEVHEGLITGGNGGAADRLATLERLPERITALEALAATDVSRLGFVRYDAFSDAESGLSYALALLNRRGDGIVLTSIYSRNDTRTFGKVVQNFAPAVQASDEELQAIERARLAQS